MIGLRYVVTCKHYGLETRGNEWFEALGKLVDVQTMRKHELAFLSTTLGDEQTAAQANEFNDDNVKAFHRRFIKGPDGTTNHIVYFDSFSVEIEKDRGNG